ncbi:MAG: hypothetical protein ACOX41_10825 [Anaerovoracaceae bacterium]|jgi:hypothetical protein
MIDPRELQLRCKARPVIAATQNRVRFLLRRKAATRLQLRCKARPVFTATKSRVPFATKSRAPFPLKPPGGWDIIAGDARRTANSHAEIRWERVCQCTENSYGGGALQRGALQLHAAASRKAPDASRGETQRHQPAETASIQDEQVQGAT